MHLKCKKENPILSCYGCFESDSILNIFNQSRTYNLLEMMYGHISRINLAYLSLFICIAVTRIPICTSFEEMKLVDSYPPRHPIYKFFKAEGDSSKVSNVKCVEHHRFFFFVFVNIHFSCNAVDRRANIHGTHLMFTYSRPRVLCVNESTPLAWRRTT